MSKIYGLTFDGVHCSAFDLTMTSAPRPIMAKNRNQSIEMPKANGSLLIRDGSRKDILITVTFTLPKKTREELMIAGYTIGEWLQTDGRKALLFDDYPTKYYEATADAEIVLNPVQDFEEIGEFTVQFLCDPIMKEVV